jgi:hypothetical protein
MTQSRRDLTAPPSVPVDELLRLNSDSRAQIAKLAADHDRVDCLCKVMAAFQNMRFCLHLDHELGVQIAKLAGISGSDKLARFCDAIGEAIFIAHMDWKEFDSIGAKLVKLRHDLQRASQHLNRYRSALVNVPLGNDFEATGQNTGALVPEAVRRDDFANALTGFSLAAYPGRVFQRTIDALSELIAVIDFAKRELTLRRQCRDGRPELHYLIRHLEICARCLGGGFTFNKNYLDQGTLIEALALLREHFRGLIPRHHSPGYQHDLVLARREYRHYGWFQDQDERSPANRRVLVPYGILPGRPPSAVVD